MYQNDLEHPAHSGQPSGSQLHSNQYLKTNNSEEKIKKVEDDGFAEKLFKNDLAHPEHHEVPEARAAHEDNEHRSETTRSPSKLGEGSINSPLAISLEPSPPL